MDESSLKEPCPVCGERPNAIRSGLVPGGTTFYHRVGRTLWFCTNGPEGKTSTRETLDTAFQSLTTAFTEIQGCSARCDECGRWCSKPSGHDSPCVIPDCRDSFDGR